MKYGGSLTPEARQGRLSPFQRRSQADGKDDPDQALLSQASGIAPKNDLEPAIVATLNPAGNTAIVSGENGTSGVALVEVYDLGQNVNSQLANISIAPLCRLRTTLQ